MSNDKPAPLVGLLVSKGSKEETFLGDIAFFKDLQKEMTSNGGILFLFLLEGIQQDSITGYMFYEGQNKWRRQRFPYPDLIYNRISSRAEESNPSFFKLKELYKKKNKYFFNPCFFNKIECYTLLSSIRTLQPFLPKTWPYTSMEDLLKKLSFYQTLFIKPVQGYKGKGIYKLAANGTYFTVYHGSKKTNYLHYEFVSLIKKICEKKQYLIQEEIHTDMIDRCKYDLRIHCLYNSGKHTITGIGVRKAAPDSIMTHVPHGGHIISVDEIKHKLNEDTLKWLAEQIGQSLSSFYGFVGEFSMDIGLTRDYEPILFEVNSKPMKFDEQDIQTERIKRLSKLFVALAAEPKIDE